MCPQMSSTNANGGGYTDMMDVVLANNRKWSAAVRAAEPEFFSNLAQQQAPDFFWIGCADSRVPANQILGLAPGEVFVHRCVGNLATHKDLNAMTCLEYAVDALKVKHIIICGHYGCGAVKGALSLQAREKGLVNLWISDIRDTRNKHEAELKAIEDPQQRWDRLCELNVERQMYNVCTSPTVQAAWERGQPVCVHAFVYSLSDGLLKEVHPVIRGEEDMDAFREMNNTTSFTNLHKAFNTHLWFEALFRLGQTSSMSASKASGLLGLSLGALLQSAEAVSK